MTEENRQYLYVRKEGNPNNLFNGKFEPLVNTLGDRVENRVAKVRQRLKNVGIVGLQPQQKEEPQKEVLRCPNCGNVVSEGMDFCPFCRGPLNVAAKRKLQESNLFAAKQNTSVIVDT